MVVLGVVMALAVSGCALFGGGDGPDEVTDEFLHALADGDVNRAADLTDAPDSARAVLGQVRAALAPESVGVRIGRVHTATGSAKADAAFDLQWHLPRGRNWAYSSAAQLFEEKGAWKLHWLPSVVHPDLAAQQTIAVREVRPEPAPVVDRDGMALLSPQSVIGVVLDPAKAGDVAAVADKLATVLHPLDGTITKQSLVDGAKALKPGGTLPVASLRATDYQQVKQSIYELPGVRFAEQTRLLPVDRTVGARILPALRSVVEHQVLGEAGWRVVTLNAGGGEVAELFAQQPKAADAVVSTLSRKVQAGAESALAPIAGPAALVAMRPSTGELLAVAQNAKADEQGMIALTGRYPPGSTFKLATATAALTSNVVRADTPSDCPSTVTIDSRVVPNDDLFSLGTVPLSSAFAHSCNTTFAKLATRLPPAALTGAARDLGIGADYELPGLTTITGSVPPAETPVQRAENGFGQGTVLASPFGMAVAMSTVASGHIPVPTLLRGVAVGSKNLGNPIRPDVLESLRSMTREVVTAGTAGALKELPEVHGKTGTAQFGDGTQSHGWFVGYEGDLAFSVLLVGGGTSKPAVEVAHRFLTSVG
ncbi:penicillin-binding transpeptidase domain-containing protein [Amycolatopsis minnesotensis]|uniref:Penicillin-binding transpeptidase domain-containing protein n=1 Tax=Amycolatopsis minnesotensis TaxID=337894 RepID=A0ABN2SSE6_9PSEU